MKPELRLSPERRLISHLENLRMEQVAVAGKSIPLRRMYLRLQSELTMEQALKAPKLMNLQLALGQELTQKLLCFVVSSATAGHVTATPLDVLEVAALLAEQYPAESVKDIMLAFKRAKIKGQAPTGLPLAALIFQVFSAYLEEKSHYLEQCHREARAREASDQLGVLRAITENQHLTEEIENTPSNRRIGRRYRKAG